jgi:hypothetical protein
MPVHHAVSGHALLIKVDGDFTPRELERVVNDALTDPETPPNSLQVLLDLTGAASLAHRSDEELRSTAGFFAAHARRFHRIAILMAGDVVDEMMRLGTAFVAQDELTAAPFRDRHEAEEWLSQGS